MSFFIIQEIGEASDYEDEDEEVLSQKHNSTNLNRRYFVNDTVCKIRKNTTFTSTMGMGIMGQQQVTQAEAEKIISIEFGTVLYPSTSQPHHPGRDRSIENILKFGFSKSFNVHWLETSFQETIQANDESIYLVDRGFREGMRVNRGSLTEGTVVQVETHATVKILATGGEAETGTGTGTGTGPGAIDQPKILCNIPLSKIKSRLKPLFPSLGDYVQNCEWIGFIREIQWTAVLVTHSDRAECQHRWTHSLTTVSNEISCDETNSNRPLKSRIRYPGQILQLTQWEALKEVEWTDSFLKGKWRAMCPHGFLAMTVKSIEPILTVEWIEQIPAGFHNQTPKPSDTFYFNGNGNFYANNAVEERAHFNTESNDLNILNHNFPLGPPIIGSLHRFDYTSNGRGEFDNDVMENLQPQTYDSWLQNFTTDHSLSYGNSQNRNDSTEVTQNPSAQQNQGNQHIPLFRKIFGFGDSKKSNLKSNKDEPMEESKGEGESSESESLKIWNSVRSTTSVHSEIQGKVLNVEILCLKSYVTVHWPKYLNRLECLPSSEFEPALLGKNSVGTFPVGSAVKFSRIYAQAQQSSIHDSQYYGVVTSSTDTQQLDLIGVNWFKRRPQIHPELVGTTRSAMHDLEPHPGSEFDLRKGHIVIVSDLQASQEEMSRRRGNCIVGLFEKIEPNGMFQIQIETQQNNLSQSQMQQFWPGNVSKFPLRAQFNILNQTWTVEMAGSCPHINSNSISITRRIFNTTVFSPSLEILGSNAFWRESEFENRNFDSFDPRSATATIIKTVPLSPGHVFPDWLRVFPKEPICLVKLVRELSLYNGGTKPRIWIKDFAERQDLFSIIIEGSPQTLYEDTLFLFTVKLDEFFPDTPPLFYFHSFSPENLNPCLTTDGQVLFPLLNTYKKMPGFFQEDWDPDETSLGLVLSCVQKMILCSVPYQNQASFQILKLLSTSYCEHLCREGNLKYVEQLIVTVYTQIQNPPEPWKWEMLDYYRFRIPRFHNRILKHLDHHSSSTSTSTSTSGKMKGDVFDPWISLPQPIPPEAIKALKIQLCHLRQIYVQVYLSN